MMKDEFHKKQVKTKIISINKSSDSPPTALVVLLPEKPVLDILDDLKEIDEKITSHIANKEHFHE